MRLSIVIGILIETGATIEVNLASSRVPKLYSSDGLLAAGLIIVLGATFWWRLRESRRLVPAKQDHVRVRLINQAVGMLRDQMSASALDAASLGQLDLRVSVVRPEFESRRRFGPDPERTAGMRMSALPDYVEQSLEGRALIVGDPGSGASRR